jgi:hypothetical protein
MSRKGGKLTRVPIFSAAEEHARQRALNTAQGRGKKFVADLAIRELALAFAPGDQRVLIREIDDTKRANQLLYPQENPEVRQAHIFTSPLSLFIPREESLLDLLLMRWLLELSLRGSAYRWSSRANATLQLGLQQNPRSKGWFRDCLCRLLPSQRPQFCI